MSLLTALNDRQREAVTYGKGPLLILAGAGSGKTRVLTYRIAHLIENRLADPTQIFAVTFTNKAAGEMRTRVFNLLGPQGNLYGEDMWVSTFHSACVRVLRSDIHHLGYSNSFIIYDDTDQLSVIKACLKELNIAESAISPKSIQSRLNKIKNEGIDCNHYRSQYGGPFEDAFVRVFRRYSEVLERSSALDFTDLILFAVRLLQEKPRILEAYQSRFPFVLVDEYQDTNRCQYLLMKLLAGQAANLCAVGDEDQSIYRWRGADISNILNFEKDFPNAKTIKLEENYRSTRNIIEAASQVIAFNTERREKNLWTQNREGEKILLTECYDEHDEAHKVTGSVQEAVRESFALSDLAVFYRTNAQSRVLEDMLRAKGIPYQIYGGLRFYDRLEVKDALAYLKLISNVRDDVSFRRIVNVPTRGIGATSLERLGDLARAQSTSYYEALANVLAGGATSLGRSQKNFREFYAVIEKLRAIKASLLPSDCLNSVLEETGYRRHLTNEDTIEAQSRLENLAELRQSVVEYELRVGAEQPDKPLTVEGFLEEIALVSDVDRKDTETPSLKLMTIHMAKGLEFERVYMVGLEEELFPNIRSWDVGDQSDIEEERRLFYVGMTRARQRLYLFYAKNRTVFGTSHFRVVSRFVEEIPEKFLEKKKADYFTRRRHYLDKPGLPPSDEIADEQWGDDFSQIKDSDPEYCKEETEVTPGRKLVHPAFGFGIVKRWLGNDKVLVEFSMGLKKISLKWVPVQMV